MDSTKKILLFLILSLFFIFPYKAYSTKNDYPRIVSLTPATTEILFALGLDKEIVGVSSFCNYPKEATRKERVGTFSQANIEKILSLKPDIIFCTGLEQAPMVTELRQLKFKVCVSDPNSLEELFKSILEIGQLTGRESYAIKIINNMKIIIDKIVSKTKISPRDLRPRVYVEFWHDPIMSAGKGSFIDELISLAGGTNISHDMPRAYSFFSPEQVLKQNPDIIILAYMAGDNPATLLKARLRWDKIKAVKNNRVYNDINPDIILRPGPRLAEGLIEIHKRLYPEDHETEY